MKIEPNYKEGKVWTSKLAKSWLWLICFMKIVKTSNKCHYKPYLRLIDCPYEKIQMTKNFLQVNKILMKNFLERSCYFFNKFKKNALFTFWWKIWTDYDEILKRTTIDLDHRFKTQKNNLKRIFQRQCCENILIWNCSLTNIIKIMIHNCPACRT